MSGGVVMSGHLVDYRVTRLNRTARLANCSVISALQLFSTLLTMSLISIEFNELIGD